VLNPETGGITPQFRVVFDDWFATVTTNMEALPDFTTPEWMQMFGDSSLQYHEEIEEEQHEQKLDEAVATQSQQHQYAIHDAMNQHDQQK